MTRHEGAGLGKEKRWRPWPRSMNVSLPPWRAGWHCATEGMLESALNARPQNCFSTAARRHGCLPAMARPTPMASPPIIHFIDGNISVRPIVLCADIPAAGNGKDADGQFAGDVPDNHETRRRRPDRG